MRQVAVATGLVAALVGCSESDSGGTPAGGGESTTGGASAGSSAAGSPATAGTGGDTGGGAGAGGAASPTGGSAGSATYRRPYGPNAPWNVPVVGLPVHPESDHYSTLLWNDSTAARPGNFNLSFDGYTYPVYQLLGDEPEYPVEITEPDWGGNLIGTSIPWDATFLAATGTDAQVILLDPSTGREWNLFQVAFDGFTITATNGNLVPGSYWTKEDGFAPSRGCGIQYLAMLVRPEEIAQGVIEHALSVPIINTAGDMYVAPATKLEHPDNPPGIPEGMRFAIDVTDEEIDAWAAALPASLSERTRDSAIVVARALRDYGWFVTDTSGGAHFQFEDRLTAGPEWDVLGLDEQSADGMQFPQDLLDGLVTESNIYALVPSDEYP